MLGRCKLRLSSILHRYNYNLSEIENYTSLLVPTRRNAMTAVFVDVISCYSLRPVGSLGRACSHLLHNDYLDS